MELHPVKLTQGHINQGSLPWRKDSKQRFPGLTAGRKLRIVDDDTGKEYGGSFAKNRQWVSGLTGFYKDHPDLGADDFVKVAVDPDRTIRLFAGGGTGPLHPPVPPVVETSSPLESLIEDSLERDPSQLEPGLRLHPNGRQFQAGGGRIDLLCQDKQGRFVVVELKRLRGDERAVGQILNYMAWVRKNLAPANSEVRGLIVAHDVDEKLENALSEVPRVQVKYYRMRLDVVSREQALG